MLHERPILAYTVAKDVHWPPGMLGSFRKKVVPIHHNQSEGNRRLRRVGVPLKRGNKGDFKHDMKSCSYVIRYTRQGKLTEWNTKTEQAKAICTKTYKLAQTLEEFVKTLMPHVWKEKAAIAQDKQIPVIPGTQSTATVVSFNYVSVFHRDPWDKHGSILVVAKTKKFKGGWLVFPEYNLSFPLHNGDVLYFNANESIHGTSPLFVSELDKQQNYRIGYVMYL